MTYDIQVRLRFLLQFVIVLWNEYPRTFKRWTTSDSYDFGMPAFEEMMIER